MKTNIHPTWYQEAVVTCACGESFTTGSTVPAIKIDICSKCHPLFTGKQKFVDTLGQVERFQNKTKQSQEKQKERQKVMEYRASKQQTEKAPKPSLKDLLMQARKQTAA